ncbi:hypothetical protein SLS56_005310 [Neofusicoccum ribis]|uniref:Uncharacterized protein n=1 Tax=Neofusicoccum ribis TaxID=45134 RepID=A0ABR3STR0_9PEZI
MSIASPSLPSTSIISVSTPSASLSSANLGTLSSTRASSLAGSSSAAVGASAGTTSALTSATLSFLAAGASAPAIVPIPSASLTPSPAAPSSPNATPPLFQCPADNGKVVSAAGQTFQIRCGVSIGLRLAIPRLFGSGDNDIGLCLGTCVLLGASGAGLDLNLANQNNCQCFTESTDLVVDPSKVAAVLIPSSAVPTLAVRLTLSLPFPTATPSVSGSGTAVERAGNLFANGFAISKSKHTECQSAAVATFPRLVKYLSAHQSWLAFVKPADSVYTHDPSIYADSFFKFAHHQCANKHPFCLSRTALVDSAERLSPSTVGTNHQCAKSISIDRIAFGLSTDRQLALVERSVRQRSKLDSPDSAAFSKRSFCQRPKLTCTIRAIVVERSVHQRTIAFCSEPPQLKHRFSQPAIAECFSTQLVRPLCWLANSEYWVTVSSFRAFERTRSYYTVTFRVSPFVQRTIAQHSSPNPVYGHILRLGTIHFRLSTWAYSTTTTFCDRGRSFVVGTFDVCSFTIGAFDICLFAVGAFTVGAFVIGAFDICPFDICPFDICPFDICPFDICPFDICPFDVCLFTVSPLTVGAFVVGADPFRVFTIRSFVEPSEPECRASYRLSPWPESITTECGSSKHLQPKLEYPVRITSGPDIPFGPNCGNSELLTRAKPQRRCSKYIDSKRLSPESLGSKSIGSKSTSPKPFDPKPFAFKPIGFKPIGFKPIDSKLVGSKPAGSKSFSSKPFSPKLFTFDAVSTKSLSTESLSSKPFRTQLVSSKPVSPKPVSPKPVSPKPVRSKPIGPESFNTLYPAHSFRTESSHGSTQPFPAKSFCAEH